jgi:hypothetical protein
VPGSVCEGCRGVPPPPPLPLRNRSPSPLSAVLRHDGRPRVLGSVQSAVDAFDHAAVGVPEQRAGCRGVDGTIQGDRRLRPQNTELSPAWTPHGQTVIAVEPVGPLTVDAVALAPQPRVQPAVTEASPLGGELAEGATFCGDCRRLRRLRPAGARSTGPSPAPRKNDRSQLGRNRRTRAGSKSSAIAFSWSAIVCASSAGTTSYATSANVSCTYCSATRSLLFWARGGVSPARGEHDQLVELLVLVALALTSSQAHRPGRGPRPRLWATACATGQKSFPRRGASSTSTLLHAGWFAKISRISRTASKARDKRSRCRRKMSCSKTSSLTRCAGSCRSLRTSRKVPSARSSGEGDKESSGRKRFAKPFFENLNGALLFDDSVSVTSRFQHFEFHILEEELPVDVLRHALVQQENELLELIGSGPDEESEPFRALCFSKQWRPPHRF